MEKLEYRISFWASVILSLITGSHGDKFFAIVWMAWAVFNAWQYHKLKY